MHTVTLLATVVLAIGISSSVRAEGEPDPDPDLGIARPDAEDLRGGHFLISVSGGLWLPSNSLIPALDGLGNLDAGAAAHGALGLGLGRYLVLQLDGGFGYVPASCDECSATSIDGGAAAIFHPAQGFALDPWVGYGLAYRHTLLSYEAKENPSYSAFDFMRLSIGADYFPLPSLGFGPFLETAVGLRSFDVHDLPEETTAPRVIRAPAYYGTFQLGMRVTWDPVRTGTSFTPGVASR